MRSYRVPALPHNISESEDHGWFPPDQQQLDLLLSQLRHQSLAGRSHGVLINRLPGLPSNPSDTLRLLVNIRERQREWKTGEIMGEGWQRVEGEDLHFDVPFRGHFFID